MPGLDDDTTWEVWLRKSDDVDHLARLRALAEGHNLSISEEVIDFIDRRIVLVHGKSRGLARCNDLIGAIAELRLAKTTADLFTEMDSSEQADWVDDLAARLQPPQAGSPAVCLLDTGLNHQHPLLAPAVDPNDLHTYKPAWGVDDRHPHGTPMAGLALHGDLVDVIAKMVPSRSRIDWSSSSCSTATISTEASCMAPSQSKASTVPRPGRPQARLLHGDHGD